MKNNYTDSKKKRDKARRDMPKTRAIFRHWRRDLHEKYGREIYTDLTCFACLREGYVQRCHIKPLSLGGSNKAKNLHLLCPNCHVESEGYLGEIYWMWFENKDITFIPMYRSLEHGTLIGKIAGLLKERMPEKYNQVMKSADVKEMEKMYYDFLGMIKPSPDKPNNRQSKLF